MASSNPSVCPIRINLDDDREGEHVGSTDYYFVKIGEAVPLMSSDFKFDLESLPCTPLAVSERFGLIFVAHSSGFFVARTNDVMDSAKEFKKGNGSPIQQLSLVDVSIGEVHILALSTDNSTVAASVSGVIQFFSVDKLLSKDVKQSFSCSLNDPSYVKDMRWKKTSENSFTVLSNVGNLYYGEVGLPLKEVMGNVDAVEWSAEGKSVAVARMNVISILSADFEEQISISLSFRSWTGDSGESCHVKVDSIKWVRPDSIVIGSFQLAGDGKEENYLLQVIQSRAGEIIDAHSQLIVQSFYDIYQGLVDDIVPIKCGPHLLLAYLNQCQLAINANRKNTDQHIMLLGWSADDDKSEAVVVDIDRDNWVPRIELQENGDDNLVLGLCIDNVSIYQKVGIQLGTEERTELTPCCVLICLTLDGRLVMFNVASIAESEASAEVVSVVPDEEKDASSKLPVEECSTLIHGLQKQKLEQASEVSGNLKLRQFADPCQETLDEDITKSQEVKSLANEHNTKLGQFSSSASLEQRSRIETQKIRGLECGSDSFRVTSPTPSVLPSHNNLQESTQMTNELFNKNNSRHSQISSSRQSAGDVNINVVKDHPRRGSKPFDVLDTDSLLHAVNYTSRSVQNEGQKASKGAGNLEMLSFCAPQLPLNENSAVEKPSIHKFRGKEHHRASTLGISTSELNLSKQFGNIHEMTIELDLLLRSIEEAGGFTDTCTRSLVSPVERLEQGMGTLSENSKIWMCQVIEQLGEVHSLLDKTIQVVARKMYMEGIFKQASDSQYWDLWNRQKLNSELELKQQHIQSLNQDLTNQLIELERHFNVLELNTFSEYSGTHVDHATIQNRYRSSRNIQSLCSVHNAMNSQLVAAENLSESLSKQMASLNIKSPSEEQKTVKELFETIGIPYQPSFGSTDMKNVINTPSSKNLQLSNLATDKDHSKKNQANAFKGCEPEMSRRRRDSLDQSWTCSEPPKTTVRRMLLQDVKKPDINRSFFSMDKENIDLALPKRSPHQTDSRVSLTISTASEQRGIQVAHPEAVSEHTKAFISTNSLPASTQISEPKYTMLLRNNVSMVSSRPVSHLSPAIMHHHLNENQNSTAKRYNAIVGKFNSISDSENKPILQMKIPQNSSLSNYPPSEITSMLSKSSEMSVSAGKANTFTGCKIENKSSNAVNSESRRMQDSVFSASSTIPLASPFLGKSTQFNVDKSHPGERILAVPSFSGSCGTSSPTIKTPLTSPSSSISLATVPAASVSVDLSRSFTSSNTNQVNSTSSASAPYSNQAPEYVVPSCPYPPSLNSNLEAPKSEVQQVLISSSKTDSETTKDLNTQLNERANNETQSVPEASEKCSPSSAQSTNDVTCSVSSYMSVSQPEQRADAPMQFSTFPSSSVTIGKTANLDATITDEDEMEEEAPETSNTAEPRSFGGFGISPAPPTPPIAFSVPNGELFRPPSFTFPSSQSSAPAQSTNSGAFSGGFSAGTSVSATSQSVFGQPAQVGSGQQALGSVLGSFGQSRQLGNGLRGSGFAASSGFGGGFGVTSSAGGFSSASTAAGGFAGIASTGGGFAGVASAGGGFSGAASAFGGFAGNASSGTSSAGGGGFAGAASGGFGAFTSQGSGFGAYGTGGGNSKPLELFTQMRK
ncbi:nuclear pore complex protein NUP214 isoform X2 [Neltuma alba]|uniref:nuclear pore complex protein NUP214 isoform X2 n=1 Tax=Neltuma alba TaxID=207710 RepID=UPI0010A4A9C2|nr:nuclear pore complex protein NUP214 isoform X2 [Prosopis alba]